jgi:hypothetical protein
MSDCHSRHREWHCHGNHLETKAGAPYPYSPSLSGFHHCHCWWYSLLLLHIGTPAHSKRPGPPGWNCIASFDLESEEWKATINGPPIGYPNEDASWDITIAVLRGSLCLVQTVGGPCSRYTSIWILVDTEKSTWVKQYTVQMPECWQFFNALDILVDGRWPTSRQQYYVIASLCLFGLFGLACLGNLGLLWHALAVKNKNKKNSNLLNEIHASAWSWKKILVDGRILMLNCFKIEGKYRCILQFYCPRRLEQALIQT